MKAIVIEEPGKIGIKEVAIPVPQPGFVRILVKAAAICATDLEVLDGNIAANYPLTPGHEWSGIVDAVGSEEDARWVGKRVIGAGNNWNQHKKAVTMMADGSVNIERFVTNKIKLEDYQMGLDLARRRLEGFVKAVFAMNKMYLALTWGPPPSRCCKDFLTGAPKESKRVTQKSAVRAGGMPSARRCRSWI